VEYPSPRLPMTAEKRPVGGNVVMDVAKELDEAPRGPLPCPGNQSRKRKPGRTINDGQFIHKNDRITLSLLVPHNAWL
jgi:hypothetical protein